MKRTTHIRSETESLDDIASALEGRVFHVTKLLYLDTILADAEIRPNPDGHLSTTFGHVPNAFFRKRNCVSVFDYRAAPTDQIRDFRNRCSPFQPARPPSEGIAILLLKPYIHASLIDWTQWKEEKMWRDMVVPYVEAGYPGPIPIDAIEEVICLKLNEDPNSFTARIRNIKKQTGPDLQI
ncbi:hypothetical protein [Candidatus Manganitrophus noduliformans]|uniref:Uncharacterized protein n=1 Tax=Candidatus Manganitrophus noduliformans TaxID=2606439 RepID=A0A7X6IA37_9BACT|nr:hypothetical protein [Candidatus Manganitrophus noduliformans]NKE69954.1 hypothetical protein [Candidatus Manganitrophus noduliformans]